MFRATVRVDLTCQTAAQARASIDAAMRAALGDREMDDVAEWAVEAVEVIP